MTKKKREKIFAEGGEGGGGGSKVCSDYIEVPITGKFNIGLSFFDGCKFNLLEDQKCKHSVLLNYENKYFAFKSN
jgi:hypothetical protein